ncbi:hypothetical protein [Shinella sp. NM-101]|uniref:hypothetical protein n=1 Tax=Shinella sp. NM-101 TaxID=2744455 RepID=UPI001F3CF8D7|nr:hypothetical protein [Shinella sp. NM-101]
MIRHEILRKTGSIPRSGRNNEDADAIRQGRDPGEHAARPSPQPSFVAREETHKEISFIWGGSGAPVHHQHWLVPEVPSSVGKIGLSHRNFMIRRDKPKPLFEQQLAHTA